MKTLFVALLLVALASGHHTHHHDHDHDHDHDHGHGHDDKHSHDHDHGAAGPVTRTAAGEFRGAYNETRFGRRFETYRGIRYAAPPVGELRFQPPVLIERYPSPVDATQDGPACPLLAPPGYPVSEDCLMLNVYTPLKKDRKEPLPVIVFIHAGGFYSMTGRSDLAGPHYLLDRDLVLVTINYRLGSLGFLSTGDELAPGNNGFKDQVAALKWVQRNIAGFGGDPQRVTAAGYSAGSMSVALHMISPMSKGLFHRGISMSGSPVLNVPTPDNLYRLAVRQAELMNCPTNNSKAIVDCLKTKPWRELGDSLLGFYEFGFDPVLIWEPVIEKDFGQERFLTMNPVDAIKQGKMHAVPYIISQTTDEFFWMAFTVLQNQTLLEQMNSEWETVAPISFQLSRGPDGARVSRGLRAAYLRDRPLRNDTETARALGLLYQDSIESFPVHRLVNLMCRHSPHPVWYYEFAYIGNHSHYEDPVTNKPVAAAHHDDLIYLFSLDYRFPHVGRTGADARLADTMTALWHNFAAHGDPNHGNIPELQGVRWPAVRADERRYLRVDSQLSVRANLKEDRLRTWEQLIPLQY